MVGYKHGALSPIGAGVMPAPFVYGLVKKTCGNATFGLFLCSAFVLMSVLLFLFIQKLKGMNRYRSNVSSRTIIPQAGKGGIRHVYTRL